MWVECRRRGIWLWQYYSPASRWSGHHYTQALPLQWECLQGDWGCLAAGAYQTTGKCQSLQAICPLRLTLSHLLLTTEGPSAVPQHKGEAPAGRGRQLSILLLFSSILVALSALWCCQVCGKFAGCCQPAFWWIAGGRKRWVCKQLVHSCCLFAQLWTLVLAWLSAVFSFSCFNCRSIAKAGQHLGFGLGCTPPLFQLLKGLKIMGKFSRHLQDMVAVATGLLIW